MIKVRSQFPSSVVIISKSLDIMLQSIQACCCNDSNLTQPAS